MVAGGPKSIKEFLSLILGDFLIASETIAAWSLIHLLCRYLKNKENYNYEHNVYVCVCKQEGEGEGGRMGRGSSLKQ